MVSKRSIVVLLSVLTLSTFCTKQIHAGESIPKGQQSQGQGMAIGSSPPPPSMLFGQEGMKHSCNSRIHYINGKEISTCRTGCENVETKTGFLNTSKLKSHSIQWPSIGLDDCKFLCFGHCDCFVYEWNKTGCIYWLGELKFIESFHSEHQYFFITNNQTNPIPPTGNPVGQPPIQGGAPHLDGTGTNNGKESNSESLSWLWFLPAVGFPLGILILGSCNRSRTKCLKSQSGDADAEKENEGKYILDEAETLNGLFLFSYTSILAATDNFSFAKKIGEGGFGPVFKGKLMNGQEIAVKKLSTCSSQGLDEFKNETMLIAKLQHTNLVRLLGCCVQDQEKMLVYEFMPNSSLNSFLFDSTKKEMLDWNKRCNIIEGIAQGLLYLHKYSRFRVIHRDLKASNILLDNEMNPKISDFGMARIICSNESEARTRRIMGTFGYISPEYAMCGIFSAKSDVFSFGVLLIEIISGRKNVYFSYIDCPINLVGYAWDLWEKGKYMELIDPTITNSCPRNEVLKSIVQVGLLCVQDCPADRPTMYDVVSMLTNENMNMPNPKRPAFCYVISENEAIELNKNNEEHSSRNDVTISILEPR